MYTAHEKSPSWHLGLLDTPPDLQPERTPTLRVQPRPQACNSPQRANQPDWVRILHSRRSRTIVFAIGAMATVVRLLAAIIDLFRRH
jgi:hypothetical protein